LTNLLIPAAVVPRLAIPDRAVTTGEPGPVWCDVSWGRTTLSRRHIVRLPYDGRAAARIRRRRRLDRLNIVTYILSLAFSLADILYLHRHGVRSTPHWWPTLFPVAALGLSIAAAIARVSQTPLRTARGDLYLPNLPDALAEQWIAANPGVTAVPDKPRYRRFHPAVYLVGALACLLGAGRILALLSSGADLATIFVLALPVLVIAAVVLAILAVPGGHTRLHRDKPDH